MSALTPYDTGKRAEPKVWSNLGPDLQDSPPIEREMQEDRFGKVDFEDDEGTTRVTVWVERNEHGQYILHAQQLVDGAFGEVGLVIHR